MFINCYDDSMFIKLCFRLLCINKNVGNKHKSVSLFFVCCYKCSLSVVLVSADLSQVCLTGFIYSGSASCLLSPDVMVTDDVTEVQV